MTGRTVKLEQLLTGDEVAELLRLPKKTLEKWRLEGTGPRYVRLGKHVFYEPADLRKFLDERKAAS